LVAIEIRGCPSQPEIDFEDQHQNRRMGVTKAQYIDATMDFMEKTAVFNTRCQKPTVRGSSNSVAGRWVQTSVPPEANMHT